MPENHSIDEGKSLKLYKKAPAPWKLKGQGIIMVYRFSKKWIEEHAGLPLHLQGKYKGGLGYVMLVNYEESPVGPYKELLLIPGKFKGSGKQSITKIYVDSESSTQNGRANWGIPKETAKIYWNEEGNTTLIRVQSKELELFSCEVKSFGFRFPASTGILPIDLHQRWDGVDYYTKPRGSGKAKLAEVNVKQIHKDFFPDISLQRPLFAVKIEPFQIFFPKPTFHE